MCLQKFGGFGSNKILVCIALMMILVLRLSVVIVSGVSLAFTIMV